jgi:serine protease Do
MPQNSQILRTEPPPGFRVLSHTMKLIPLLLSTPLIAFHAAAQSTVSDAPELKIDSSQLARPDRAVSSFAPVVERVAPSVVSIYTTKIIQRAQPPAGVFNDPFFRRFFGESQAPPAAGGSEKMEGLGSGVIVSPDGHILTNNHVVAEADEIMVSIGLDRREYKAQKIGSDPGTDLAVLKIDAKDLKAITFADSDKARVGDVVLAIGNPFGLKQTVTMGIISATGRVGMGIVDYENFIQTDAAINVGNSGGALVDIAGRLVGINTAIFTRTGYTHGVGFAVPSNLAREVMQSIREKGRVIRGFLGTIVQPVTPELAEVFKLPDATGALVSEISLNSPAAKAGIWSGDIIKSVAGKPVENPRDLRLKVGAMAPGTNVEVKLIRDGQEKTVQLLLGELPTRETEVAQATPPVAGPSIFEGVQIAELNSELRRRYNISEETDGVVITGIQSGSAAYKAGLREGDVIQEIDKNVVKDVEGARALSEQIDTNKKILLRVSSQGISRFLVLDAKS